MITDSQRFSVTLFTFIVLTVIGAQVVCVGQEEQIMAAQDAKQLRQAFHDSFRTESQIDEGMHSSNPAVAIQCAWKKCRNRIWETGTPTHEREHISWFLGWMEGRMGFAPPSDWVELLLSSHLT